MTPTNEARPAETGEAPERIWLHGIGSHHGEVTWCADPNPSGDPDEAEHAVEYVRATPAKPGDLGADAERGALDCLAIAREHEQFALNGQWIGVSTPHYALSGLFKMLGDEIERLRTTPPASVDATIERCAQVAESPGFIEARDTEWDEGVNYAKRYIADAIRTLSATPTHPDQEGGE